MAPVKKAPAKRKAAQKTKPYSKPAVVKPKKPTTAGKKTKREVSLRLHRSVPGLSLSENHYTLEASSSVEVHFQNLGETLVYQIDMRLQGDLILAAVAWLTSVPILEALDRARTRGCVVLVLVQKEGWLRGGKTVFARNNRARYDRLGSYNTKKELEPILNRFYSPGRNWSFGEKRAIAGHDVGAVRCIADEVLSEKSARRMHHKFVAFVQNHGDGMYTPNRVWTGSYNFSYAAEVSLENAVLIHSQSVAAAYVREFVMTFLHSEPLDWVSKKMLPTFKCDV